MLYYLPSFNNSTTFIVLRNFEIYETNRLRTFRSDGLTHDEPFKY